MVVRIVITASGSCPGENQTMGGGVVEIRSFLNSDVPKLVSLWNRQIPLEGRLREISAAMLESHVFSKMYFDPNGLLIANINDALVGAAFCGFAPDASGSRLDTNCGILSHMLVEPSEFPRTWQPLFATALQYFARHETKSIYFGSRFPDSPFLAGFCGGTFVPGIVDGDVEQSNRLRETDFRDVGLIDVLKIEVSSFKPPMDRRVVMAKRNYEIRLTIDPLPESWWQHNLLAFRHQFDFRMFDRRTRRQCGFVSFCNSRPQDAGWDTRFMGISQIQVSDEVQRSGLGQAMLFDAVRDLEHRGVIEIEAQVPRSISACQSMLTKIGFRPWFTARQTMKQLT